MKCQCEYRTRPERSFPFAVYSLAKMLSGDETKEFEVRFALPNRDRRGFAGRDWKPRLQADRGGQLLGEAPQSTQREMERSWFARLGRRSRDSQQ